MSNTTESGKQRQGSIQDEFLNNLRREKTTVSMFLVNGIKLVGQIKSFDQYVILLENSVTEVVYKRAISTVVPMTGPVPKPTRREPEIRTARPSGRPLYSRTPGGSRES